ncbi:MAG: TIGR03905 family TSCPD domain-containing protein [Firmicutes bacterium]|nr:TIGR03905 family TSCPD domain-containing protein [Bacillota bacterium]
MFYSYTPQKTCSHQIQFEIDNGIVKKVSFAGGCNGNLKGIAALVEGLPAEEVVERLSGITCGFKSTSCPDQLACAIKEAMAK